ncbi:MAG: carboxypeptidase-like regulatory domain-containing protein, partial [Candidatus Aminicenantes bacterium]|nr:carboxypeptidase-like regulatory domain-containing protein [Candidatus Aminicenantes bacterium]
MKIKAKILLIESLLCLLIVALLLNPALASENSSLTGIVRGEGGLPLFGVLVYLSDGRGNQVVGLTDRGGSYSFNKLHPGIYLMELELLDFPQVAQAKLVE